jgi:hypothetical protein
VWQCLKEAECIATPVNLHAAAPAPKPHVDDFAVKKKGPYEVDGGKGPCCLMFVLRRNGLIAFRQSPTRVSLCGYDDDDDDFTPEAMMMMMLHELRHGKQDNHATNNARCA